MSLVVKLPEELREPMEAVARQRGETVEEMVREIVAEYLEDLQDALDVLEARQDNEPAVDFDAYLNQRSDRVSAAAEE